MSNVPPTPSDQGARPAHLHPSAARRRDALAILSLVMGTLGMVVTPATVFMIYPLNIYSSTWYHHEVQVLGIGAGPLLLVLAVFLGSISLVRRGGHISVTSDRRFGIAGVLCGTFGLLVVLPLVILVVMPAIGRAREASERAIASQNLRAITQAMVQYAAQTPRSPTTTEFAPPATGTSPASASTLPP